MTGIEAVRASAHTIPTPTPESDGTIAWDATTLVLVEARAGGERGWGYSYADPAAAAVVEATLGPLVTGLDPMAIPAAWAAMVASVRNAGRPGIASHAIAAVDIALWDLKARLLGVSLLTLLGAAREAIAVYGSGGFTSASTEELADQLGGWVAQGIASVKMKVGRDPGADPERVAAARAAIGADAGLFVDANGAYSAKQALAMAGVFAEHDVSWFEEPVSSDDLSGLRLVREQGPPGMAVAAGEYAYDGLAFRRLLEAGAVDVLQADATRCLGVTGFLAAAALADAHGVALSAHTAPSVHAHLCCAVQRAVHVEYFADHVRIEDEIFDGALHPVDGALRPDPSRPGLGIEPRPEALARWAA